MRTYLVDATNAVRRHGYAPGFEALEELETEKMIRRISSAVSALGKRVSIELFFDGPRRNLSVDAAGIAFRFSGADSADSLILGTVRAIRAQGRGAVVATEDSGLSREVEEEGGRVIGFGEFFRRLQSGRA